MRRWAWSVAAGVMVMASIVRAGIVLLNDGKTIEGSVALVAIGEGKVNVQPAGKAAMSLNLTDVKMAALSPRADAPSRDCDGVAWRRVQVGNGQRAGTADINGRSVTIRDSSDGFRFMKPMPARRDALPPPPVAFCFVLQKLQGDGEIVAKVAPSDQGSRSTRAGLVICEGIEGTGPMVMLSRTPDPMGASIVARAGKNDALLLHGDARVVTMQASWLKLTRAGTAVKAYESYDGAKWTQLTNLPAIKFDENGSIYIGVAATGNFREGLAHFDLIALKGKRFEANVSGAADSQLPDSYTALTDGTVLASVVESVSGSTVKLRKPGSLGGDLVSVGEAAISRSQFVALTRSQAERLTGATTGILTRDGDFLEGEIKSMGATEATVSSVAFGLTTIERARMVAIAFTPPTADKPAAGLWEVHLQDGSIVMARKLSVEKDAVVMDEPLLGTLKAAIKDVMSFEKR